MIGVVGVIRMIPRACPYDETGTNFATDYPTIHLKITPPPSFTNDPSDQRSKTFQDIHQKLKRVSVIVIWITSVLICSLPLLNVLISPESSNRSQDKTSADSKGRRIDVFYL